MRSLILTVVLALTLQGLVCAESKPMHGTREEVFSPGQEPEALLVSAIDRENEEILCMAFGLTSIPVAEALIRAKTRNKDMRIVVVADRSNLFADNSITPTLEAAGITVLYDCKHPIMHSKLWFFGRRAFTTGSYNPSAQAKRNAENLQLINDPDWAKDTMVHFEEHAAHSLPRELALQTCKGGKKKRSGQ